MCSLLLFLLGKHLHETGRATVEQPEDLPSQVGLGSI